MKLFRAFLTLSAWLFLAGVIVYVVALRCVAESFWLTTAFLYMPHGLILIPAGGLFILLILFGRRRLAAAPAAASLILVFGIMGPSLHFATSPSGGPHLRILTQNAELGHQPTPEIVAQVLEAAPDVIVIQESSHRVNVALAAALPGFATHEDTQFFIASRYPILEAGPGPQILVGAEEHSSRFMRYVVDSPLGALEIFSTHPISPHTALDGIRGNSLKVELATGHIFVADRTAFYANVAWRRQHLEKLAEAVARATHPVIVAGDTNLPTGSSFLTTYLGGLQDAFAEAGFGFGYTFPADRRITWMRLDRILGGPELRFTSAAVGKHHGSDHFCVYADVERRDR